MCHCHFSPSPLPLPLSLSLSLVMLFFLFLLVKHVSENIPERIETERFSLQLVIFISKYSKYIRFLSALLFHDSHRASTLSNTVNFSRYIFIKKLKPGMPTKRDIYRHVYRYIFGPIRGERNAKLNWWRGRGKRGWMVRVIVIDDATKKRCERMKRFYWPGRNGKRRVCRDI